MLTSYLVKSRLFRTFVRWVYEYIAMPVTLWVECLESGPSAHYVRNSFWHLINNYQSYTATWDDYLSVVYTAEYLKALEQDVTDRYSR